MCSKREMKQRRAECERLADLCFPEAQGHQADHLRQFFNAQFCESHTCDRTLQEPFPLGSLHGGHAWGWVVVSAVVISVLVFFYAIAGFWVWEKNSANRGDLRHLKRRGAEDQPQGWAQRAAGFLPFVGKSRRKTKAY